MTPEQQSKVYRSKIVPGAKVLWKGEQIKNVHLWQVQSIENNTVTISKIFRRGDLPSISPENTKVVSIDEVIGGRLKDATIPVTMPEKHLAERVKLLYPTHINSLKFFCKNRNFRAYASEMIWRDEQDNTQVKVRVLPVQEDIVNPQQGELLTGVRALMTIIIDGERIPVFVNEKDAMTLTEGGEIFFKG
eukprot:CAMPEP_0168576854 /NCGR_PEP_ID=MMETSP0413-20121227/20475_1 /TAXON_ID=136452 /ORGANISM="Filamoeba nolandi, Strain NC-AS-23-1" /LENGTH=189 /DNA_ID=CAMNT_0008610569 /DNA_START=205 /DNA_END=775 /DNA_ORIENTATION=-